MVLSNPIFEIFSSIYSNKTSNKKMPIIFTMRTATNAILGTKCLFGDKLSSG